MKNTILILSLLLLAPASQAEEPPLDPAYKNLQHPEDELFVLSGRRASSKNNALAVVALQTSVKAQGNRGTCSIFSATALLESMLILKGLADPRVDLSEEWLQYLIAQKAKEEGSNSVDNFIALRLHGIPIEEKMPYVGATWNSLKDGEAEKRCGHVKKSALGNCLTGHRDPALLILSDDQLLGSVADSLADREFFLAREDARKNKKHFFTMGGAVATGVVRKKGEIKDLLDSGIPLTLDLDFYYGAWNHSQAESLGINRDLELWDKGLVSYPEEGSVDRAKSGKKAAGHSVVIVGYDDEREIEYSLKMTDGRMKTFKRKGVYYFKNSWGSSSFGLHTEIEGKTLPGYGVISQDYAEEFGQFFQLDL